MLLIGCPEAPNEGIQAAPCLPKRAGARRWWVWDPKVRAVVVVDLGLAELIQVAEELQHVSAATHGLGQRRAVVPEVLAEGVPVSPLLVLIPARRNSTVSTLCPCTNG